ncbi:hypothetical protein ES703_118682 [subsurface metagenome]
MGHGDCYLRQQLTKVPGYAFDAFYLAVNKISLTGTVNFFKNGTPDQIAAVIVNGSDNGDALKRGCIKAGYFADTGQGKMQRTGNRSGGQAQDINTGFKLLDALFLFDAKALLLVNNKQSQALEGNVIGQDPVGTDNQVSCPGRNFFEDPSLLCGRNKTGEHLHVDGKRFQPGAE